MFWFPCRLWGGSFAAATLQPRGINKWSHFPLCNTQQFMLLMLEAVWSSEGKLPGGFVGVVSSAEPPLVLCWLRLSELSPGSSSHRYQGYLSFCSAVPDSSQELSGSESSLASFV